MVRIVVRKVVKRQHPYLAISGRQLQPERGQPGFKDPLLHRQQARKCDPRHLDVKRQIQFDRHVGVGHLPHLSDAGGVGDAEKFGQFGADLRSVAVGGLAAADHHVELADRPDSLRQRVTGREHIRPPEPPVREEHRMVHPHHERLTQHRLGLRRPHGQCRDFGAQRMLEPQRGLQRVKIVRIEF